MDGKEARMGCDRRSTSSNCSIELPAVVKKEEEREEMDEEKEEEGKEKESLIADLRRQLAECEEERDVYETQMNEWTEHEQQRARDEQIALVEKKEKERVASAERAAMEASLAEAREGERTANAERAAMERSLAEARAMCESSEKLASAAVAEKRRVEEELDRCKTDLEWNRKKWNDRLEEAERERARLEVSLKWERMERAREQQADTVGKRARKRLAQLTRDNEDLKDRNEKLLERMERPRHVDREEQRVREERRETERKMERLERIREEMSKVLENSASVHSRLERERDEMREAARGAEEKRQRISIELCSLHVRFNLLESDNKRMAQRLREDEERQREEGRRMREMERERKEMEGQRRERFDEAAKLREDLAKAQGELEELRDIYKNKHAESDKLREDLTKAQGELEELSKNKHAEAEKLRDDLAKAQREMEELRDINEFLVKTKTGELFQEVLEARERIGQLEREIQSMTGATKEEEDDEVKRKRPRRDEKEEVEDGEISDEPDSPPALSSCSNAASSHTVPSLQLKITVARSITEKIALSPATVTRHCSL